MTSKTAKGLNLRFLADVNVEKRIVEHMASAGFDIKWIADYECGMGDDAMLDMVRSEGRILLTNDKDFGQLVFLQKRVAAGIILFRVRGQDVHLKVRLLKKVLNEFGDRLSRQFTVVTTNRIRFVPLEASK
jgi:predicted nuclease of predicted toxin-antitoxin system